MVRITSLLALVMVGSSCIFIGSGGPDGMNTESDTLLFEEPVDSIVFDVGAGDVTVRSGDVPGVVVERTLTWGSSGPDLVAEVVNGELTLTAKCEALSFACGVDHVITVPGAVNVDGETGSGDIEMTDVAGNMNIGTGSGTILLENIVGNITAESGSGGIQINGATGNLNLETGSGRIECTEIVAGAMVADTGSGRVDIGLIASVNLVDINTGSGAVDLSLPSGRYNVLINTGSGGISVDGIEQHAQCESTISISTGSGRVSVEGY